MTESGPGTMVVEVTTGAGLVVRVQGMEDSPRTGSIAVMVSGPGDTSTVPAAPATNGPTETGAKVIDAA